MTKNTLLLCATALTALGQTNNISGNPVVINGNVGIETAAPSTPLEVVTRVLADAPAITMTNANNAAGGVGANIQAKSGGGSQLLGQISFGGAGPVGSGGVMDFYTSSDGSTFSPRMRITAAGDVGIGTYTPDSPLTVTGVIESSNGGFKFPDGSVQTTATARGPQGPQGPAGPPVHTSGMCSSNVPPSSSTSSGCRFSTVSFQSVPGGSCQATADTGSWSAGGSSTPLPTGGYSYSYAVCAVCSPQ